MDTIQITLPDGATREVARGTTPAEIASQISPRLAKEALVARANGELTDLSRPLDHDTKLSILTAKDPDALQVFRHSAAHLLAAAVLELYPNVKLGIGPPIENGFFYEFVRDEPFTPEDLEKIEAKMHELAEKNIPNERKLIPKPEAIELYRNSNQEFKCELVEEKAIEPMVSFYTTGKFIDFCRGPHLRKECSWTIERIESESKEFLRRLTIMVVFDKFPGLDRHWISNWNGSIASDVERRLRASAEWKEYEELLLATPFCRHRERGTQLHTGSIHKANPRKEKGRPTGHSWPHGSREKILDVIQRGSRGLAYCRELDNANIGPRRLGAWKGAPSTYTAAYQAGKPWPHRIQDEKSKINKKAKLAKLAKTR